MNIFDFEQYIDEVILERGKGYFENHKYRDFMVDGTHYSITAQGTQDYHVEATLDSFNDIVAWNCDCPYVMGDVCKHEVALFFTIRSFLNQKEGVLVPEKETAKKPGLDERGKPLSKINPKRLTDKPDNRFNIIFQAGEGNEPLKEARRIISFYFQKARKTGFIEYDQAPKAFTGVAFVFQAGLACPQLEMGVALCLLGIEKVHEVGAIDDSDGFISEMLYTGEHNIKRLLDDNMENLSKPEKKSLFDLLLKHMRKYWMQDLDFSGGSLIETLLRFGRDPDLCLEYDRFLKTVLQLVSEETETYETEYRIQSIELLQFNRINLFESLEQREDFLEQHLHNPDLREILIRDAIAHQNFNQALLLIKEGKSQEKGFAGRVDRWDKLAFEVYSKLNQTGEIRKLAFRFLLNDKGEYYESYLGTFPLEKREQALNELLNHFEKMPHPFETYIKILIKEKKQERLMGLCEKNPYRIEQLYSHLMDSHRERVQACFLRWIWEQATNANNRKEYKKFCGHLKLFKKIFPDAFPVLLKELREAFARRPAMLEELNVLA